MKFNLLCHIYRLRTKLREGYIFSRACLSAGVPCDHYPWCLGPRHKCTNLCTAPWTYSNLLNLDLNVPGPLPPKCSNYFTMNHSRREAGGCHLTEMLSCRIKCLSRINMLSETWSFRGKIKYGTEWWIWESENLSCRRELSGCASEMGIHPLNLYRFIFCTIVPIFSRAVLLFDWKYFGVEISRRTMCRRCADDTRVRLHWRFQLADDISHVMSFACCPHMYTSFACHLYHSSYTLLSTT